MLPGAITPLAGCVQTQDIDQTLPPYASISDDGRDPASAPKPPPSDDSGGFMSGLGIRAYVSRSVGSMFGSTQSSFRKPAYLL